ncbi:hypothetical protein [Micromonospora sp. NBRC 101691]|uniref:hypothetical protein n=1 Tax=Micromonospora sp. NBRC 101691 TaxID=3032198 RepID=UPI0024A3E9B8|nr:hypothetical protein [Micromonospora sp. NBRC 101691]GLY20661.1 hypothetical protein Misp04_03930 [Micromonospora sp. NBRC 101691]
MAAEIRYRTQWWQLRCTTRRADCISGSHEASDTRLAGSARDWSNEIVTEMRSVSDVEFFDDPFALNKRLDRMVPLPDPARQL